MSLPCSRSGSRRCGCGGCCNSVAGSVTHFRYSARELNVIDRPGPFKISASISISSPNTHAASFPLRKLQSIKQSYLRNDQGLKTNVPFSACKGYDKQLKELLEAEILPMAEEFDKKENDVKEMKAKENKRIQMWCNVPFHLPVDMEVIWRFAEEVNTQQVDQFNEVTAGMDRLYSIPSTSLQHQGTYQCEIYSGRRSIVRLYFYLAGGGCVKKVVFSSKSPQRSEIRTGYGLQFGQNIHGRDFNIIDSTDYGEEI
ncbi:hypothetical protein F2P81_001805 [Scophthalmus maximus]|uniref:Ig-like domain-containing protein n=1 Tax=Scophthalmus maximus TaxID=52904 RepID=A0A6A4TCE3_SCOMX|nr:hypothetical protein F2P81_001805 [Scophthalmus maximus]